MFTGRSPWREDPRRGGPYDPAVIDDVAAPPPPAAARERLLRKPVLAWAAWDWGSSAFNAVVTTFVFTVWITSTTFVEAGQEKNFLAQTAPRPRDNVGDDLLVGMAEMRLAVHVINRGGDVKPFAH